MSAIRSASSRTMTSTAPRSTRPRCSRSMSRPGRGHHDLDTVVQGLDLAVHAGAAVTDGEPLAEHAGERLEHVGHLPGQLAGRHQDKGARPAGLGPADALEQRQTEGEGLARAGLGLAADVAPGERIGENEGLDGEGLGDALGGEGLGQLGRDAEGAKRCGQGTPVGQTTATVGSVSVTGQEPDRADPDGISG